MLGVSTLPPHGNISLEMGQPLAQGSKELLSLCFPPCWGHPLARAHPTYVLAQVCRTLLTLSSRGFPTRVLH